MGRLSGLMLCWIGAALAAVPGCAQPDTTNPCRTLETEAPPGSPWPPRDEAREAEMLTFYRKALRGIDGLTQEDLYAFVRQGALGGVPVVATDDGARAVLGSRFEGADQALGRALWTPLDPHETLGRLHMARYRAAGLPFEDLFQAAAHTTATLTRDPTELNWRLCLVRGMVNRGELPLTRKDWPGVASLWEASAPAVHSVSFRHYQQPAYVVLRKDDALPLIKAVESAEAAGAP